MVNRVTKMVGAGIPAGSAALIGGDVQDSVTAAGTTQATATAIYGDNVIVTTAAASTGVIISDPPISTGDEIQVANLGANAVLVYPPVGGQINALAVNAGFSVGAGEIGFLTARADSTKFIASVSA